MLYSNLYKRYFPIKSIDDLFEIEDKDLKILSKWITGILHEIDTKNFIAWQNSRKINSYFIYLIKTNYNKDVHLLEHYVSHKEFHKLDIDDLVFINNVLYRHKYNWIISTYQFPVIRNHKIYLENFFWEEKMFLNEYEFNLLMEEEMKKCPKIYFVKEFLI